MCENPCELKGIFEIIRNSSSLDEMVISASKELGEDLNMALTLSTIAKLIELVTTSRDGTPQRNFPF